MPAHQVPPYRAVSARLRPCAFSQSTPIGLDRVGCRRLMRASNSECRGPPCSAPEMGVESSTGQLPYNGGARATAPALGQGWGGPTGCQELPLQGPAYRPLSREDALWALSHHGDPDLEKVWGPSSYHGGMNS